MWLGAKGQGRNNGTDIWSIDYCKFANNTYNPSWAKIASLWKISSAKEELGYSYTYGVAAVFKLKTDIRISGGTGTINDPYIIY